MRPKPLSYKRAIEACLKHQDLIGMPFSANAPEAGKVARIVIAPYNRILQWQFLNNVYSGADPDTALAICRDGKYEVLLLSNRYKPDEVAHRPRILREYLEEQNRGNEAGTGQPEAGETSGKAAVPVSGTLRQHK